MNNNDKKVALTTKSGNIKNQNRESAEIQQINAISDLNTNKNFNRSISNDDSGSPRKIFTNKPPTNQQQTQAVLLNKSISPRIQKTVMSLLNSSSSLKEQQKNKPNVNRSSRSPIKNRRRKFEQDNIDDNNNNNIEDEEENHQNYDGDGDKENEAENYYDDEEDDMMNTTNYDKDDSLLDVESIGKQTPFRMDSVDASFSVFGTNYGYNSANILSSLNEEPIQIKTRLSKNRNRNKKLKQNEYDDDNQSNEELLNQNPNSNNNNREKFFSENYSDDGGYEFNGAESPLLNENKGNKNRYSIIETEFFETADDNNNNINNPFKSSDTGYQGTLGGSNNSLRNSLNRIISKNSSVKNKNLSYGKCFFILFSIFNRFSNLLLNFVITKYVNKYSFLCKCPCLLKFTNTEGLFL